MAWNPYYRSASDPVRKSGAYLSVALTAKRTNGRANYPIRAIDITELPETLIRDIQDVSYWGYESHVCGDFETGFRDKFAKLMSDTTRVLWTEEPQKWYSLYSCRHQACSNWRILFTEVEIAALMGHALTSTLRHYGSARNAWTKDKISHIVRPTFYEVEEIVKRQKIAKNMVDRMTFSAS